MKDLANVLWTELCDRDMPEDTPYSEMCQISRTMLEEALARVAEEDAVRKHIKRYQKNVYLRDIQKEIEAVRAKAHEIANSCGTTLSWLK